MLSDRRRDDKRFRAIIDAAILDGRVESYPGYEKNRTKKRTLARKNKATAATSSQAQRLSGLSNSLINQAVQVEKDEVAAHPIKTEPEERTQEAAPSQVDGPANMLKRKFSSNELSAVEPYTDDRRFPLGYSDARGVFAQIARRRNQSFDGALLRGLGTSFLLSSLPGTPSSMGNNNPLG